MLSFFARAYRDARSDPFFSASPIGAVWFVLSRWRWLRAVYADIDAGGDGITPETCPRAFPKEG